MDKFRLWYFKNRTEITWFLMGWLTLSGIEDLSNGNYVGATMSLVLAYIIYKLK